MLDVRRLAIHRDLQVLAEAATGRRQVPDLLNVQAEAAREAWATTISFLNDHLKL